MKVSRDKDRSDQFVSVTSVVKDLYPKVVVLQKELADDLRLVFKYHKMTSGTVPGAVFNLNDVHTFLLVVERALLKLREVGVKP